MKVKIKTGFAAYKDNDLPVKAQKIHDDMAADSADYSTPSPSLASGQTKINTFLAKLADRGTTAKTAAKKAARKALIDYLNSLALYVQQNCGNDEETALKSGYDIWKTGTPVGDLPKPKNFTLASGNNSREIYASMDSLGPNAKSYTYRYTQEEGSDQTTWKTIVSTNPKALIGELVSGKKVFVQGAGVGASKHQVWSNVISMYVL